MATTVPTATPPRRRRGKLGLLSVLTVILLGGLFALYVWATLHINYSDGERAGYVQKFSRKGWVCKTWEGELAMVNLPGTLPQIFNFSVRDPTVAGQINKSPRLARAAPLRPAQGGPLRLLRGDASTS